MKFNRGAALLLVAICIAYLATSGSSTDENLLDLEHNEQVAEPQTPAPGVSPRQRFKLPKIFDFELYKKLFKRAYEDVEEIVRKKLVLARAFRVWISSLSYKYRRSSFYLAMNHLSDRSPTELERMMNHHLDDRRANLEGQNQSVSQNKSAQTIPDVDPNQIEEDLELLVSGDDKQVDGLRELQEELQSQQVSRRRKRSAEKEARELDMARLISAPGEVQLDAETARKVQLRPESNNPDYEAPELASTGVRDDNVQEMVWYEKLPPERPMNPVPTKVRPAGSPKHSIFSSVWGFVRGKNSGSGSSTHSSRHEEQLPDEVFFDHRDSRCMFLPRNQGDCGSCYAFVAIAIAEWMYCRKTGQLVAFSEQYMIDCGRTPRLVRGCDGATDEGPATFIHNYGLELRDYYPYREMEDECPYDEDTHPKTMGYVRMDFGSAIRIPLELVPEYLRAGPMEINMNTKNGFHEYGGGVMDGAGCEQVGEHAVLLIGHGREDGREYWLIRNSFGVNWGEQGYYKLAKDSDCIDPRSAHLYGSRNGKSYSFRPAINTMNNPGPVRQRFASIMAAGAYYQ